MVTKEGFERLDKSIHYTYAWKYKDEPADDIEQKEKSDDFLEAMVSQVMAAGNEVEDYTCLLYTSNLPSAKSKVSAKYSIGINTAMLWDLS